MSATINAESADRIGKIAVSESAKGQIGAQASQSKALSADTRWRGSSFLDSFQDFPEFGEGPA
jgi:hypothetical protein